MQTVVSIQHLNTLNSLGKKIIIIAIAHRDYSIKRTDIQIKMFDDRITVESPCTLPGIVRLNNLRSVHFSRNPKIARFFQEYEYVKEFGYNQNNYNPYQGGVKPQFRNENINWF